MLHVNYMSIEVKRLIVPLYLQGCGAMNMLIYCCENWFKVYEKLFDSIFNKKNRHTCVPVAKATLPTPKKENPLCHDVSSLLDRVQINI